MPRVTVTLEPGTRTPTWGAFCVAHPATTASATEADSQRKPRAKEGNNCIKKRDPRHRRDGPQMSD